MTEYYGAIEAGGTKFNCAILDATGKVAVQTRIATTTPEETLESVIQWFSQQRQGGELRGMGIASFGPLDLNKDSARYGWITSTPKPHWSDTPLLPRLASALDVPVVIDTDVNGAALAEATLGAGKNQQVVIYITVGTGVGGGVVINGAPLHGTVHPEIGHMLVPGHPQLKWQCPFHANCVEGFASGTAMGKIWGQPAETLPDDHIAWELEALVLAQLCHSLMLSFSPNTIVIGGGVMAKPGLLSNVIAQTRISLNDYLVLPSNKSFDDIIVAPKLGQNSGLLGAFLLAKQSK
ncbi:ROK family protein [Alteromonas facilis]|uniref:ROK family protein n=1 Tax=Alteromonas facilis TaxID=2048004 RepID=UPI000C282A6D|nr:ROK family protein [Alteromonas facilis]